MVAGCSRRKVTHFFSVLFLTAQVLKCRIVYVHFGTWWRVRVIHKERHATLLAILPLFFIQHVGREFLHCHTTAYPLGLDVPLQSAHDVCGCLCPHLWCGCMVPHLRARLHWTPCWSASLCDLSDAGEQGEESCTHWSSIIMSWGSLSSQPISHPPGKWESV